MDYSGLRVVIRQKIFNSMRYEFPVICSTENEVDRHLDSQAEERIFTKSNAKWSASPHMDKLISGKYMHQIYKNGSEF